jgi:lipopolysaccharide export system protein LptA
MKPTRFLSAALLAGLLPLLATAQSMTPQTTVIESDGRAEMVRNDDVATITFRDNVRVTGTNMKLTCDYLEVVVVATGDKSATLAKAEKFRSLLATGNVRMIQGDREAACGRAEVLPEQEKVILSGNPVVVDHDQNTRIAGKIIRMFRGQRKVEVDEPILTAPPIKDLGADKSPAPKQP